MPHKIGVDFGTTYCKIAYLTERGDLQMFRYPSEAGQESISTAMVATSAGKLNACLGDRASPQADNFVTMQVYERYRALLQFTARAHWLANGWVRDKSPVEVTRDYFCRLLQDDRHSFTREVGPIASLVVAAPEAWHRSPGHAGPQTLRQIFLDDLSLPLASISSEPVCAAAYFAYRYQQSEGDSFIGNLLVCDVGGETFKVTLCRLCGPYIEVLDHEGTGDSGLSPAGTAFDRSAVTTAYVSLHGACPVPDGTNFRRALRAFEKTKIQEHPNLLKLLELQREVPELADTPLYVFQQQSPHSVFRQRYTLDAEQLRDAFRPIEMGMTTALSRLQGRAQDKGWQIDRLALVGGFSHFPFVRTAILQHLGISARDTRRTTNLWDNVWSNRAVAVGAALIAGGLAQPAVEYYPHTLGIFAHRKEKGVMVETFFPVIEAGKVRVGQGQPSFVHDGTGKLLSLRVDQQAPTPLRLYQRLYGTGKPRAFSTSAVTYPPAGLYHLGLAVDQAQQVSVLFKSVTTGEEQVYPLGQLSFASQVEEAL